jgi:multiple sugar transport system ATP-binding protein
MTMGDRVAVMRKGELQQVETPQTLYDHPLNIFVGGFIGSPAMNMLVAKLERSNGALEVALGDQRIRLGDEVLSSRPGLRSYEGSDVVLGVRPEHLEDAALAGDVPSDQRIRGQVELREALGSELMVHFRIAARPAATEDVKELAADVGDEAVEELEQASAGEEATIVGRFEPESGVKEGETAEVAVQTRALHFFDPETGLGIYDETKGASA